MSQDINVDIQDLKNFLDTLKFFQDRMQDSLTALKTDWQVCDESWQGDSKRKFEKDFSETLRTAHSALADGDDAVVWLENFHSILEDFERV